MRSSSGSEDVSHLPATPSLSQDMTKESVIRSPERSRKPRYEDSSSAAVPTVLADPPADAQVSQVTHVPETQDADMDSDEFDVEVLIKHRFSGSKKHPKMEYYVKWKGYPDSDNTWEPEANFNSELLRDYWMKQPRSSPYRKRRLSKFQANIGDTTDDQDEPRAEVAPVREVSEEIISTPKGKNKSKEQPSSSKSIDKSKSSKGKDKTDSSKSPEKANSPSKQAKQPLKRSRLSRGVASTEDEDDRSPRKRRVVEEVVEGPAPVEDEVTLLARATEQKIMKAKNALLQGYTERVHNWEKLVTRCHDMRQDESELSCWLEFDTRGNWAKALEVYEVEMTGDVEEHPRIWVPNELARTRCPKVMCRFYEERIKFSDAT